MLHYVTYVRPGDEQTARQIANHLGVQAWSLDCVDIAGGLIIGQNWQHQVAGHIRDVKTPLIVFDKHTDMYCTAGIPEKEDSANWVYFQLKQGREVHLMLTNITYIYKSSSRLPKGSKLTVYSSRGAREARFNLEAQSGCLEKSMIGKRVKHISELSKLKSVRKQISFDEDFLNENWKASELEALLAPIVSKGDTIDFWVEGMYYTSPKTIAEGLKAACSIL